MFLIGGAHTQMNPLIRPFFLLFPPVFGRREAKQERDGLFFFFSIKKIIIKKKDAGWIPRDVPELREIR